MLSRSGFAGATPLHRAAGLSCMDCVQALLAARADGEHAMPLFKAFCVITAGGVPANLSGGGSAPSSREAFPERSRQPRVPGQEVSQRRREGGRDRRDVRD